MKLTHWQISYWLVTTLSYFYDMTKMTIKNAGRLFSALLICSVQASACTIFMKCVGGKVLVGNNEDYIPTNKSWLWIRPKIQSANGYVLWGFKEKYPEGGMNEKGLFIDAAALPEKISIIKDPNKPDFDGYITEKVLRECSSVEQAVRLVSKYNLTWQEKAQIMIVDKSGDYAVIHANYIVRKTTPAFALTNYSIGGSGPASSTCWRRNTVEKELKENPLSVDLFRKTLAKTAQTEPDNATVYSQVCDLESGTIYLYQKHNFNQAATVSLPRLLSKGRTDIAINTFFPRGIGDIVTSQIQQYGLAHALKNYALLKKSAAHKAYDFSEGELDRAAYGFLNRQKFEEAVAIFRLNKRSYSSSANAKAGLANALLLQGNTHAADQEYLKVRHADPSNYYLNLFSHHEDNIIPFIVLGFDGAKAITLFLRNTVSEGLITQPLNTVKTRKWETSVKVPPGQYTYSFRVDDSYVLDPRNRMTKPVDRYLNSFLISR
jgi:tetratricopeptide (TPR) repeat protein